MERFFLAQGSFRRGSGRMRAGTTDRGVRIRPEPRWPPGKGSSLASAIVVSSGTDQEPYGEAAFRREVGRRIRVERICRNLSQHELAARAGVGRNFVGSIERGVHGLDAWRLRRVAGALGRSLGWLLGEDAD